MAKKTTTYAMKDQFINNEIWILTFGGGFQRASIYKKGVDERLKAKFRNKVKEKILRIVRESYTKTECNSDDHVSNICKFSDWTCNLFHEILDGERLNIGVSQKLLNLYLKYQWCLDNIPKPPHCPLDRIVISQFEKSNTTAWTRISKIEDYERLIKRVEVLAGTKSIAEWELEIFNRRNQ